MRRRQLRIPLSIRRAMISHAKRVSPHECCGLLIGGRGRVEFAVPCTNVHPQSRTRFRLDDREHIELRRLARRFVPTVAVMGVYHSHPGGGSSASVVDVAESLYPEWVYAIVGLGGGRPSVAVYQIRDGRASKVSVKWAGRRAIRP